METVCKSLKKNLLKKKGYRFRNFPEMRTYEASGVVGRERMGTAFPHKKLSGNGVSTREILCKYLFNIAIVLN